MSETNQRSAIADAPISLILQAQALATETDKALRSWRHYLDGLRRPYEIILLQETRPEAAPMTPEKTADSCQPTRTVCHDRATGQRDALSDVIRTAQHPLLAFCPCDQQYQPDDLQRLLKDIDHVDLVVGYRVGQPTPFWRVLWDTVIGILSRIVVGIPLQPTECWLGWEGWGRRWIARWVFGVRVHDPECPFRVIRREVAQKIPIQSKGSFAQIEMLAKANHMSCLIAEEPVTWTPPAMLVPEATAFAVDAWAVFRHPEFRAATSPPRA